MCNSGQCPHEKKSGTNRGDCVIIKFPGGWICPGDIENEEDENNEK